METEPFKPQLRLIVQCSIPIGDVLDGDEIYNELKIFLLSFNPDITLNGQVIKPLEPCCKKQEEKKP